MSRSVSVAAALIVRNEAAFLAGCLESLRSRVDDVIIVDTGSTDETMAIAESAGIRPLKREWREDFSEARNAALDAVTCEWVLYIDADERLALHAGERLGALIDPTAVAAFVRFRPKTGYTRYRELRLFRSDPRIRFRGRIHESIWPSIAEVVDDAPGRVVRTAVEIDHLGYDGDQSHKHPRNLPLLRIAIREEPERVYYWHHLAETLAALGQATEAEAIALEGMARAERELSEKQRADASLLLQTLVRLQMQRGETSIELIRKGLARAPEDYALHYFLCRALLDAGQPDEALDIALQLRRIDASALQDGLFAFEYAIFREKACELAAIACLRMGRKQEAARHFGDAADLAPQEPHYRVKARALGLVNEQH
jgi:tetratricopeptide (TPR) repeat protein